MKYRVFLAAVAISTAIWPSSRGSAQELTYQIFERYLEPLVNQIGMPGLSAIILRDGRTVWQRAYGYADVEQKVAARVDTPYPIGGVTQAITGVLLGVCVDRHLLGPLGIDAPIRDFVPTFPADATVRHVLAHVWKGRYEYDPGSYSALTAVVEQCTRQTFREATAAEILNRLAMTRSVPGLDLDRPEGAAARLLFSAPDVTKYQGLLRQLAVPYRVDRNGRQTRSEYPAYGLDASGGLVATATDLAELEKALYDDTDNIPISRSTINTMWTATVLDGTVMPTGLGWFVTRESGQNLVWTFGYIPNAGSALIVKLPSKNLTLILLSNSGLLAKGDGFDYGFEQGRVTESPFVKIFLRLFI